MFLSYIDDKFILRHANDAFRQPSLQKKIQ